MSTELEKLLHHDKLSDKSPEVVKINEVSEVDLNKNFNASVARLNVLKAGRSVGDIPLSDEYWIAVKKHRIAHHGETETKSIK